MSADNGIFIAGFMDGWRVALGFASDLVDMDKVNVGPAIQYLFWKESSVYETKADALNAAYCMEDECGAEYGIMVTSFGHRFPLMTEEQAWDLIDREIYAVASTWLV